MKWTGPVFIICMLWSGAFGLMSRAAEPNEVALGRDWLYVPERALVLDIHHSNLVVHCRQEAGELTQGIVRQLISAGYTVYFSREYLERELAYYELHVEDEPRPETARQVASVLRQAQASGMVDWATLRKIHLAAPDAEAVNRGLPWLNLTKHTNQLALAANQPSALPTLEFAAVWEGQLIRGLSVSSSGAVSGTAYLWKIDAQLRLRRDGQTVAEKHYEAPPWPRSYSGFGIFPYALQVEKIMKDVDQGLENPPPPPAPAPEEPKKKKRKFLFF